MRPNAAHRRTSESRARHQPIDRQRELLHRQTCIIIIIIIIGLCTFTGSGMRGPASSGAWRIVEKRSKSKVTICPFGANECAPHIVCAIRLFSSGFVVLRSDFGVFFGLFFWSARAPLFSVCTFACCNYNEQVGIDTLLAFALNHARDN